MMWWKQTIEQTNHQAESGQVGIPRIERSNICIYNKNVLHRKIFSSHFGNILVYGLSSLPHAVMNIENYVLVTVIDRPFLIFIHFLIMTSQKPLPNLSNNSSFEHELWPMTHWTIFYIMFFKSPPCRPSILFPITLSSYVKFFNGRNYILCGTGKV